MRGWLTAPTTPPAYAFEAAIHQNLGDARRRGFAGTGAIKNDVSISGKILEVRIDILQGDGHGTRNPMRLQFARGRGTDIDNERTRAILDELVELGDADACHAQHLVEAAPLPPFVADVARQQNQCANDRHAAVPVQLNQQALYLRFENHAAEQAGARP